MMETYVIPFEGQYIIYRPLRRLAFLGNAALVRYIQKRDAGASPYREDTEAFLNSMGYWSADTPVPEPWIPCNAHQPTTAVLLMTSACNLRCTYCYARGGEDARYRMSWLLARTTIDTAYRNARLRGRNHFSLTFHGGGEPTLNWKVLVTAVEYAKRKDLPCEISMATNGVWSERQRRFILQHFSSLSISFDGVREVQDAQRPRANGKGSFSEVIRTIHDLDEHGIRYGVRLTAVPDSFDRLAESIDMLCKETRCKTMQVEPCYSEKRGTYIDPSPEEGDAFTRAFLAAFQVAAEAGRTLFYSGARPWVVSSAFCRAPENALVVTPEGDIVTCFETHDKRHPLLSDFAVGQASSSGMKVEMSAVRRFAETQEKRRKACEGCFCYWHCGGDCAARCLASPNKERGRCRVNRAITRELLAWDIARGAGVGRGKRAKVQASSKL
jgi:uncharacterized protein